MSEREACELLDYIELERKPGSAYCYQIGNGEWVCIVKNPFWFCWSFACWLKLRQSIENRHPLEVAS